MKENLIILLIGIVSSWVIFGALLEVLYWGVRIARS